jgi:predicted Zn-dependent protease
MDMKTYYQRIRAAEAELRGVDVMVTSLATPDGGREGVVNLVRREIAARLLVDKKVRLATEDEVEGYERAAEEMRRQAEMEKTAQQIQVVVIPSEELSAVKTGRGKKN